MGAFSDLKVVDLTSMVSGPVAACMLADQGATVIKVEPVHGEQMRYLGPALNGAPPTFYSCNRGKQSLALDLKSEAGKDILWKLIKEADVLIQNFRPGAMTRMGFSDSDIRSSNPAIIYVSISGFGEQGPYANQRVYDPVIQALSGATDIQADRQSGKPAMFRVIMADKVASLTAAQAISTALYHRERTGEGQDIQLSMLDSMLSFLWPEGMGGLTYQENEYDPSIGSGSMDLVFPTQDGYITAGAITDAEWRGMCAALNREDLISDPRFITARDRGLNGDERKRIMADEISKWTRVEILERMRQYEVPSAPLLKRTELLHNDQIVAGQSIETQTWEGYGEVRQAKPAAKYSRTPSKLRAPAPKLGEHSKPVLSDLGFSNEEIERLFANAVVK